MFACNLSVAGDQEKTVKRTATRKSKSKTRAKLSKPAPWSRLISPLRFFLVLVLTFGISSVGRAAEKIKRGIRNKKSSWKASYAALLNAKAWAYFRPAWQKA